MKTGRSELLFVLAGLASVVAGQAGPAMFDSPQAAREFITRTLPAATAANPKYTTQSDGTVSEWLTQAIVFRTEGGVVTVAMRESYTQAKAGAERPGKHAAVFSLADVDVSDFTEAGDVTPAGEPSRGLLFRCAKPGCVAANWDGVASRADKTDVSVQDAATRDRLLAAFHYLQDTAKGQTK